MNTNEVVLVYCTFPDLETARQVGTFLVKAQLVACVNLIPQIESIFRWQGVVESAQEVQGIFKTTKTCLPSLQLTLSKLHPYDTPEFIVIHPESVSERYADWVKGSVSESHRVET